MQPARKVSDAGDQPTMLTRRPAPQFDGVAHLCPFSQRYVIINKEGRRSKLKGVEMPAGIRWATFLSHCWGTGQDQVAQIYKLLLGHLPDIKVFLDVNGG